MGVVRRQSIKHSIVSLTGLLIGALSTMFLYPHVLDAYGLVQTLLTIGIVGLPLLSLGGNTVVLRYFPRFEDPTTGHHGFLPLLLLMCFSGWTIAVVLALIGKFWLGSWPAAQSRTLHTYLWMAAPLALFYIVNTILNQYSSNFQRIVVPTIIQDFSQKLLLPILLFSVWKNWITLETMLWLLLLHGALVMLGLAAYIAWLGQWRLRLDWDFLTPDLRREMARFILFGGLGGFALLMASRVDVLMVSSLTSLKNSGIYAIALYIAAVIEKPTKSLYMAAIPLLAKNLSDNNQEALSRLYHKVAVNLTLAGLLLFGATWISVDSFFDVLPNGEAVSAGKYVLLFIGLARILETITGLNNYLIYISKYYIYSLVSLTMLACANLAFNFWLIPRLGLTGAAVATLLSVSCYNLISLALVWNKFRLQPFSAKIAAALLSAGGAYLLIDQIPRLATPLLDILLHSGLYVLVFGALVCRLRISDDLHEMSGNWISKWKNRRNNRPV
ncbi:MAG: lipopolysaccharide biosynthesis protein [Saprospiraceae bacterium]